MTNEWESFESTLDLIDQVLRHYDDTFGTNAHAELFHGQWKLRSSALNLFGQEDDDDGDEFEDEGELDGMGGGGGNGVDPPTNRSMHRVSIPSSPRSARPMSQSSSTQGSTVLLLLSLFPIRVTPDVVVPIANHKQTIVVRQAQAYVHIPRVPCTCNSNELLARLIARLFD